MKRFFKSAICLMAVAGVAATVTSCSKKGQVEAENNAPEMQLTKSGLDPKNYEGTYDYKGRGEKATHLYTLTNKNGMEVCITNFGGRIVSVMVPDKDGNLQDVVLSFPSISDLLPENNQSDFGASIGRYANRINKGHFVLDGEEVQLNTNNYGHMLHGYDVQWQYCVYDAEQPDSTTVSMSLTSPDGEANFPGEVNVTVTMKLTEDNAIDITYEGTTDKTTILNMTNHSYFNLSGDPTKPVTDHIMWINADNYTPTDATYMTTGEIKAVKGTTFDFTQPKRVGQDFDGETVDPALEGDGEGHTGYDHNWCLNTYKNGKGDDTQVCATVYCPSTGIQLDVYTNEPGIQFYSGNFQDGTVVGKKGLTYPKNAALCLETQKYPDAPNKPQWPSCTLRPGEKYYSHCVYKFSLHK